MGPVTARPASPPGGVRVLRGRLSFRAVHEPRILTSLSKRSYVVNKRQVVLGGFAAVSALATSIFAAGAAFASSGPVPSLAGLSNVTREAASVTNLQMVNGLVPVAGGMSGLNGLVGAASGLGLAGLNNDVSRATSVGGAVPGVSNVTNAANLGGVTGVTGATSVTKTVSRTIGSVRSVSSMSSGASGLTGELPNVTSISGLLRGATSAVPTLGSFSNALNTVK